MNLEITELKKNYAKIEALRGVSLSVNASQIVGLVGHNGCGKTTIIKSVLGLVQPSSGTITLNGINLKGMHEYRNQIGYMPQNADYPSNLTVSEIIETISRCRKQTKPSRVPELIELFGLRHCLDQPAGTLSGGTKQRLAAVIAFGFESQLIILDEPTAGLDPVSASKLKGLILSSQKEQKAVLLVSHILTELEQLLTDVVYLQEGLVRLYGTVDQILNRTSTQRLEDAILQLMIEQTTTIPNPASLASVSSIQGRSP